MRLCSISFTVTAACLHALAGRAFAFNYGTDKIRGVNLGGWLVLESWITPSLFAATKDTSVVDEWTYGAKYGSAAASTRLQNHWNTFVTEDDFALIKSYGLNHVRIPIGYWAVAKNSTERYPTGQYSYLKKAIGWAAKHGLKVMIDLHGAPGSQNGFDGSGHRDRVRWHTESEYVERTRDALWVFIRDFVANPAYRDTVTSIELLNEPAGFLGGNILDVVKQYYYDGYGAARWPWCDPGKSGVLVSIHDAFQSLSYWKGFMKYPGWENVALDTHFYTVYSAGQAAWTVPQHVKAACDQRSNIASSNQNLWTFIGEWAPVFTDCARSLKSNAYSTGSFFDGTNVQVGTSRSCSGISGDASKFSITLKNAMRQFWEAQVNTFEAGSGWIMWTWKTEKADEWSYMKGVEYGWIPKDPTWRKYPNPCDTSTLPQGVPHA